MTGRWQHAAGALAAVGALAFGGAATAQAWDVPSVTPSDGAVLEITSDAVVENDPLLGQMPVPLVVPAAGPAAGEQPGFDPPSSNNAANSQWIFKHSGGVFGSPTVYTISPVAAQQFCLTASQSNDPSLPVTLQGCGAGDSQDWHIGEGDQIFSTRDDDLWGWGQVRFPNSLSVSADDSLDEDGATDNVRQHFEFFQDALKESTTVTVPAAAQGQAWVKLSCPTPYHVDGEGPNDPNVMVSKSSSVESTVIGTEKEFYVLLNHTDARPAPATTVQWRCVLTPRSTFAPA